MLELGTEIVASADGTIAGLLGASRVVPIVLTVLQKVFKDKGASPAWQEKP